MMFWIKKNKILKLNVPKYKKQLGTNFIDSHLMYNKKKKEVFNFIVDFDT